MARRSLLLVLALGALLAVVLVIVDGAGSSEGRSRTRPVGEPGVESRALRVLHTWDAQRARAYARGDGAALSELYTDRSRTGAADRAVLHGYTRRGLRVRGMTTQVLSVVVLTDLPRRIVLRVTEVLLQAAVVDRRGKPWALPHDQPSTRQVVLVRPGDRWLVAETYPAD
jgi:hypothetical protein